MTTKNIYIITCKIKRTIIIASMRLYEFSGIAAINNQVDSELRIFYRNEKLDFKINSHTSRNCILVKRA